MKLLLYCTKGKPYLYKHFKGEFFLSNTNEKICALNGLILAECDFEVEEITYNNNYYYFEYKHAFHSLRKSCLDFTELDDYLKGKNGYAIHIKNLHIFDEPKELSEYYHYNKGGFNEPINNAPQNMMYAYNKYLWKFVLISIHPEYLCKILNGEKTIEVRKKVLKEML